MLTHKPTAARFALVLTAAATLLIAVGIGTTCATEPKPRPAAFDPSDPAAAASTPLVPAATAIQPDAAAAAAPASAPIYTCPMHPEVISDKPGRCPKCGMKLVAKKPPRDAKK